MPIVKGSNGKYYNVVAVTNGQAIPKGYKVSQSAAGVTYAIAPVSTQPQSSNPLLDTGKAIGGKYLANKGFDALLGGGEAAIASEAPTAVGTALNGGTLMSDGTVAASGVAEGGGLMAAAAPLALAGVAAYTGKEGLKAYEKSKGEGVGKGAYEGWKQSPAWMKYNMALAPAAIIGGALGGVFGQKSTKEIQNDRRSALSKVAGAKDFFAQVKGGANAEGKQAAGYAPDFVGDTKDGYVNNKFAQSRDEKDLRVNDTVGGTHNFEVVGDDYLGKWNEAQRNRYNQLNLDTGNIDERKGGLYFRDEAKAKALRDQINSEATPQVKVNASETMPSTAPKFARSSPALDSAPVRDNLLSKLASSQQVKDEAPLKWMYK